MNELFVGFITKIYTLWTLKSKSNVQNVSIYDFAGLLSIIDKDLAKWSLRRSFQSRYLLIISN